MKDKYLFKNWEENDVFAWKIDCNDDNVVDRFKVGPELEQYQGRYLLFVYTKIQELRYTKSTKSREKLFRVKITPDKKLPETLEDINNCEYLATGGSTWIDRFYGIPKELLIKEYEKPTIFPNKYGLLYIYFIYFISLTQKKIKENWIYLGNFDIELPKDEYIPEDEDGNKIIISTVQCPRFEDMQHYLLYHYLRKKKERQELTEEKLKKLFLWQSGAIYGSLHLHGVAKYGLTDKEWMRIIMSIPHSDNSEHLHLPSYEKIIEAFFQE